MLRDSLVTSHQRGSVLLEVVLALALFVGAATVITAGINASIQSTERLRLQNHASNLALSVMSEMQMHIRPIAAAGPEPFQAPFDEWTWQIEVAQDAAAPSSPGIGGDEGGDSLRPVEVIIRHSHENVVRRITQLFRASEISITTTNEAASPFMQSSAYY